MISTKKNIKDPQTWLFSDKETIIAHEATIRHDAIVFLKFFKDIGLIFHRKKPLAQSITWSELDSALKNIEPKSSIEKCGSLIGRAIANGNIESVKYLYSLGYSMYDLGDQRKTMHGLFYSYNHSAINLGENGSEKFIKLKEEKLKFISEAHPNLFFNSPTKFLFNDNFDLENFFNRKSFGNFLVKRYFIGRPEKPKDIS